MSSENDARIWPGQVAELALSAASIHAFHTELLSTTARLCAAHGGGFLSMRGDGKLGSVMSLESSDELTAALNVYCAQLAPVEIASALNSQTITYSQLLAASHHNELCRLRVLLRRHENAQFIIRFWPGRGPCYRALALICRTHEPFNVFAARAIPMLDASFPVIALAERLLEQLGSDDSELPERVAAALGLTPAQRETLQLLVRGLTNREIASALGISANTVRNRLVACFRLLGASTRTEALFILNQAKHLPPAQSALARHVT